MTRAARSTDGSSLAAAWMGSLAAVLLVMMTVFDKQHPLYLGLMGFVVFAAVMRQAKRIRVLEEQLAGLSHNQSRPTI